MNSPKTIIFLESGQPIETQVFDAAELALERAIATMQRTGAASTDFTITATLVADAAGEEVPALQIIAATAS